MRLQALTVNDPGGNPVLDYEYTYDATGNIVTKATEHGEYGYGYDSMSRLISADNPVLDDEAYTYDNVGNRLTAANVSGSWNYNANNELLGFADVEYEYDDNGNMTQITIAGSVVWTYGYDAANRLVHVEDGTGTISADYYYDPFGRRLWKDVGGVRTYFFYSEEGLIAEYDATGIEIRSYGYKPDSTWMTDPLWLKEGGSYYWYQNDHLGTPQKLTAQDGAVVWSAQYTAFGEATIDVETVTNNLRFPGQYEDTETGLHYNYFRYYDPKIGRYLRIDQIGLLGGINMFLYANNNPLVRRDVYGLHDTSEEECCPDEPGSKGCCGPDVTDALTSTLEKINEVFDLPPEQGGWNDNQKFQACVSLYRSLYANPTDSWDIAPLFAIGRAAQTPTYYWPDTHNGTGGNTVIVNNEERGDCEFTVQYKGKCHNAGFLNFMMYGVANRKCYEFFTTPEIQQYWGEEYWGYGLGLERHHTLDAALNAAMEWKIAIRLAAFVFEGKGWSSAGFQEVPSAVTVGWEYPLGGCALNTSEYSHCQRDDNNKASNTVMPWRWEPVKQY